MSSRPAAADVRIALIPALAGSGSGSSSALAPAGSSSGASSVLVQPGRKTYSVFQVVRALYYGVPAIPVLEDGHLAGAEDPRWLAARGRVRGVVVGTRNSNLRACGRTPMIYPEGCSLDLNAALAAHASQPPPERGLPVICAHCNCAFCFGVYEAYWLTPPLGEVYPEAPAPATADLVTPPPVEPLYGDGALPGPGASPLLVCPNLHHFMVAMAKLKLPYNAPSLVWRRPSSLDVLPTVC